MARMLADANPGHGQVCRHAARGCRCYTYKGKSFNATWGSGAHRLRRRAQRHRENAALRRELSAM